MNVLDHVFSIEIDSKKFVKNLSLSDEAHETVLFEGTIGKTNEIMLQEGDVLEITGSCGTIRISISKNQLLEVLKERSLTLEK